MNHEHLMQGMRVQQVWFTVRPTERIVFHDHAGSALRGGLYRTLADNFCSQPFGVVTPDHTADCPVCWLLAMEDAQAGRGRDIPRPLTIEPPEPRLYERDELFRFGLTVIGKAQTLLPHLTRAVQQMGQHGIGPGRGRFELVGAEAYHPLLDAQQPLMNQPSLQVTAEQISEAAAKGLPDQITLELRSPLRLIAADRLVKQPDAAVFIQRLIERCQNLATYYAETPPEREAWLAAMPDLLADAGRLQTVYNDTWWVESWSGSRRRRGYTPVSGLMGAFRWAGDVTRLRFWLLWGQSLHVGKDAVKGNGWYAIRD